MEEHFIDRFTADCPLETEGQGPAAAERVIAAVEEINWESRTGEDEEAKDAAA